MSQEESDKKKKSSAFGGSGKDKTIKYLSIKYSSTESELQKGTVVLFSGYRLGDAEGSSDVVKSPSAGSLPFQESVRRLF